MGEDEEKEEEVTEEFELNAELSTIVENNLLPAKIVEKIGQKIEEYDIKIDKEQLYQLVEKIQSALRSYKYSQSERKLERKHTSTDEYSGINIVSSEEDANMKKLVESIEELKEKIKTIEENRLEGIQGITGKIVKTKDVTAIDKIDLPEDKMQPLEVIPNDPESIVVSMKWLQYLVDKLGKNRLPDVLGYYVDIDWISDDVRLDLLKYSKGITDENNIEHASNLSTKDHIQSLLFIQKLKGNQLDERFIWRIDREMEKMGKSIEDYQFK